MMMMKKPFALLMAVVMMMGLLAGCGKTETPKSEQKPQAIKEKQEVHIGYQTASAIIMLAKLKGWYDEEFAKVGVTVKYDFFLSGPPLIEAMSSQRVDFGTVGDMPPVSARAAGIDLKVISRSGVVPAANALLVRPDAGFSSVQELKGKKIAVQIGSSAHHFLVLLLQKNGLKTTDVNVVNLPVSDHQKALESKNIDAVSSWEPWVALLEKSKAGKVLVDSIGIKRSLSVYIVNNEFAIKNPDLVERFLKVNQRATEYIKQHPDEVLELVAKDAKIPKDVLAKSFLATDWDPRISNEDVDGFRAVKDFLKETNVIKKDFDVNELIDRRYLKNIGIQ
ncbi:MAG TPA: aliphatic sulfonate ABC transporter substrate-binding protein [Negativicutes bacterium]|nr:aliphatic sulfonate ABC transporter substrate-binding protein [Negativicutes bacterium]